MPGLLFLAALVVFHTLMPFEFGLTNSAFAFIPFLVLASTDAIRRALRSAPLALLAIGLLGAHYYARSFVMAGTIVTVNNRVGEQLAPLKAIVEHDPGRPRGEEAIVMTRIPWEVHLSTGYKAVQIPNDDLPTILTIARRYRVNYLLLPAPRQALAGIYEGTRRDERFRFVAAIPYTDPYLPFMDENPRLKLFRLVLPGPPPRGRPGRPATGTDRPARTGRPTGAGPGNRPRAAPGAGGARPAPPRPRADGEDSRAGVLRATSLLNAAAASPVSPGGARPGRGRGPAGILGCRAVRR